MRFRSPAARSVFVFSLVLVLSGSMFGATPREPTPRDREQIVKVVKRIVRTLGDLLRPPTP